MLGKQLINQVITISWLLRRIFPEAAYVAAMKVPCSGNRRDDKARPTHFVISHEPILTLARRQLAGEMRDLAILMMYEN